MRTLTIGLFVGLALCGPAQAERKESEVAGWMVSVEKDPFGTDDRIITVKPVDGVLIGYRCFAHVPQIVVVEANIFRRGGFSVGEIYSVKLRIDDRPIVLGVGQAASAELLQIEATDQAPYKGAATGKELAIRIEHDGRYADYRLPLAGATRALKEFYRSCDITPDAK